VQSLAVDVRPIGTTGTIFAGKTTLSHPDVFAFLPYQASPKRHVVAVYVSSYDVTRPMPEERYHLAIRGFSAAPRAARLYDPIADRSTPVEIAGQAENAVELNVRVVDYPRLLILEQFTPLGG
jgi:hypothetical protein